MLARTLGLKEGWIVRSHTGWGGETRFKNLEGKAERETPKRIISTSGGLGLLHNALEILFSKGSITFHSRTEK